jgi:large subunit ribosomal protein L4
VQRGALRSALSLRVKEDALTVVQGLGPDKPSTKVLKGKLDGLGVLTGKVLLVEVKPSDALSLSARNLPKVAVRSVAGLHAYDVLAAKRIVLSEDAAAMLTERLSR